MIDLRHRQEAMERRLPEPLIEGGMGAARQGHVNEWEEKFCRSQERLGWRG